MVPGFEVFSNLGTSRLVYMARRQGARTAAEQLDVYFWRFRVDARCSDESVLLPFLLPAAARPELAQPGGEGCDVRRHAILVQTRRLRVSSGCGGHTV